METSTVINIIGILIVVFIVIVALIDIKEGKKENEKIQELEIQKEKSICAEKIQPSLRNIIELVKDWEKGGRKIDRLHNKIKNETDKNHAKELKETKLSLDILESRGRKIFKKEMNKILGQYR